jgi:hypothetical protein
MKKSLLVVLLLSVAINGGVAATVGWQLWAQRSPAMPVTETSETKVQPLNEADFKTIRAMWSQESRQHMFALLSEIEKKNGEVIDLITKHPGNVKEVEQSVEELLALKNRMDREAFNRIDNVMANLPEEKRTAFAFFVKNRSCVAPGAMGRGRGRGKGSADCWCKPRPAQSQ